MFDMEKLFSYTDQLLESIDTVDKVEYLDAVDNDDEEDGEYEGEVWEVA